MASFFESHMAMAFEGMLGEGGQVVQKSVENEPSTYDKLLESILVEVPEVEPEIEETPEQIKKSEVDALWSRMGL